MKTGIKIEKAEYVEDYKIKITFSNGKINIFDYESLIMRDHEESIPYRNIENFKNFQIVNQNKIVWGENWDLLLPLYTLYSKKFVSFSGRKPIPDKKILITLYIKQSIIDKNGGIENCKEKCEKLLTEYDEKI